MAERPRLKETDEILYSVAKKRRSQPVILPTDVLPPPILQPGEEKPSAKQRAGKPAPNGSSREGSAPEEPVDHNPLDFGKYELKPKRPRAKAPAPVFDEDAAAPALVELVGADEPAEPEPAPVIEAPAQRRAEPAPAFEPASFAEPEPAGEPAPSPIRKTPRPRASEAAPPKKPILSSPEAKGADVQSYSFPDWEESSRKNTAEREAREAARKAADAAKEAKAREMAALEERRREAAKAADEHRGAEARRKMLEDDRYRENAIKQLSSQFEEQFSQQFDRKKERKAPEKPSWVPEKKTVDIPLVLETGEDELPPARPQRRPAGRAAARPAGQPPGRAARPAAVPEPETAARRQAQQPIRQPAPIPEPEPPPQSIAQAPEQPVFEPTFETAALPVLPEPAAQPVVPEPALRLVPQPPEDEAGADEFFAQFEREIQEEEDVRAEDFRETLAQKFMRERERYLEELGIADRMEAERAEEERLRAGMAEAPPEEPPRRRLNLAIQPEMHLREGEVPSLVRPVSTQKPPPRPVTYSRNAAVEPQRDIEETENGTVYLTGPDPELFRAVMNAEAADTKAAPAKKSAEQMLLELGEQTKRRAVEKPLKAKENAQFSFSFKNFGESDQRSDEEDAPRRKDASPAAKLRARIIALAAAASLLMIALLSWGVSTVLDSGDVIAAESDEVTDGVLADGQPLEIYSSYTATEQTDVDNVLVKRTDVTLGNLNVAESIVVEELATVEGPVILENIIVEDMIYVKSSGATELDLTDVRANRIVINNDQRFVTIRASGNTDVGTVEVRTGAVIEQGELTGEAPGVQNVIVRNEASGEPLDFAVNGAAIQSLNTLGSVNATFEGAAVESMTADGDLSLGGTGRVQTLSAGLGTGQGAGDVIKAAPLSILIKGVEVGHFNLRSSANINVSANIDSMAVSDSVNIGGNGMIASLVLNEKFGNSRLAVDLVSVSIQQLTANAEAVIYANGSSTVNTLTANASTYALGNKVNTLVANADGVIYENEPDARRVAQGVAQPQSKADNPHLDYSLTGASATVDAGGSEGLTLGCEHGPELGGYRQGDGSRGNPFLVEDAAMLAHVTEHPESHFVQSNDINIADDSAYAGGFPVLCSMGTRFSGSYDGQGYAIRNLSIYAEQEYVGLFAENTGTIMNVRIDSGDVTSGAMDAFAGAVVGFNYQGGEVLSCSNGATVAADLSAYAGGVVGYNFGGKVHDCYNTARVTGGEYAGGVVGMNRQDASVTGSYNVGLVEANGELGGIAGGNEEAVITNCFYLVRGEEGLAGTGTGGGNAVAVGAEELSSAQMAATLAAGNSASLWRQSESDSYPYPVHERPSGSSAPSSEAVVPPPSGDGEDPAASDPFANDDPFADNPLPDVGPAPDNTDPSAEENVFGEDFADYETAPLID